MAGEKRKGRRDRKLQFEPLENGLDYLESVIDHLAPSTTSRDLKYAILHLAAAIEVLTKARLAREHWSLIFQKIDDATQEAYSSGDFISVNGRTGLERLRKIAALAISADDLARVKAVVDKRNRLQHHGLDDTEAAVRSVAVSALDFLLTFIDNHLRDQEGSGPGGGVEASLERIRTRLSDIRHLVDTRMASLASELDAIETVVECPSCRQPAFVPGDPCRCRFCLAQFEPEEAAEAYVEEVLGQSRYRAAKGRDECDLYPCFGCGLESLVRGVRFRNQVPDDMHSVPMIWLCFADEQMWTAAEVGECFRCGQPTHYGDDGRNSVCSDCFEYAVLGND